MSRHEFILEIKFKLLKLINSTTIIMFMNIKSLDLNLILAFDAVMRERNVTKAAQSLFMTQPALSNALNRLRHVFKDDLFIRGPKGMRPTSKALELAGAFRSALNTIENAINPAMFDPANSTHEFRVICNDHFVQTALPTLTNIISRTAPNINMRLYPAQGDSYQRLDDHSIDFGISAYGQTPDRFRQLTLISDDYVVLMSNDNPLAKKSKLSLVQFCSAPHLLVTLSGDPVGFIDKALKNRGMSRRVALTINQFSSAPEILANTPMLLTLPRKLAEIYTRYLPLTIKDCPLPVPRAYVDTLLIWHNKLSSHPANNWFKETLVSMCEKI